ncbi:MAG: hypothetical protein KQH63_12865 [Desulfobulbaceae bacterium]|nr:hypothetical protein [Desulfobulbaceae bacterium]
MKTKTVKGRYPWRLGATSFVIPDSLEENVLYLADRVDDVQLLFFESPSKSLLPHVFDVEKLLKIGHRYDLSYTVHLPIDIRPGNNSHTARQQDALEIAKIMEMLCPLMPLSYDLHLDREKELPSEKWLDNLASFLSMLKNEIGTQSRLVAVENIDYRFEAVRNLVLEHDFALCLDFGHALFFEHDMEQLFLDIPKARHIHYHGVRHGKDHQAVGADQGDFSKRLAENMDACGYSNVVTLEVYNKRNLLDSLSAMRIDWQDYEKKW